MAWDIASKTITENFTIAKVMHHSVIMVFYSQTQQHQVICFVLIHLLPH